MPALLPISLAAAGASLKKQEGGFMEMEQKGLTGEIADFVAAARFDDFPRDVRNVGKRCIVDGMGVILAGIGEPCVQIVRSYALSLQGREESSFLGLPGKRVPAHLAALANGTSGHAMDWDDTALSTTPDRAILLHPTLQPLAAGLAVGEKLDASGRDFLTAFLTGFEVECKIAQAIHPDHWLRGYHTSNTCGIFGAATAASKLMGLRAEQVRNALAIAVSMAAGVNVNHGTMVKPLHMGRAAENGIVSALLAASGYEGHPDALEGHKGFFFAFSGGCDPAQIHGKLGRPFAIIDPGVSIKPYPCGVVGHPAMDTMKALVSEHRVRPEEVEHVKVSTGSNVLPPRGPLRYRKAQTALQAKFCVPFQMASMIIRRKAGIAEFSDDFVQSPQVQEMMDRVEAVIDPAIDAMGKDKIVGIIEMRLKDGRTLRSQTAEHYRGGPRNPFTPADVVEKFLDCTCRALTPERARAVVRTIESLEQLDSIRELIALASEKANG
jgi:2-methylcitrate dehydratase PrpD